ncbi:MAG: MerR family transcriptional regulator [Proteobacteria bacterium]|nr:MerR family transcriptional regulator [Pseudomonadota bacterium]
MNNTPEFQEGLSIAAVERDTGLLKDTLRVWERRYGFPQPLRDANGERLYPPAQIARLRQIKRLMDQGMRPGKIFAADEATLAAWLGKDAPSTEPPPHCRSMIDLLQQQRSEALRQSLQQNLLKLGLQRFVTEIVVPLNIEVGLAWLRGDITVGEEHLYSELLQNMLRNAVHALRNPAGRPRILLTTLPDELHSLGLLMAEAMLVPEGAVCTSLGTQTPLGDIASTAMSGEFDIVALSFSANYPARQAWNNLAELRRQLPAHITLWAGGRHLCERAPALDGLHYLKEIADAVSALESWRTQHQTDQSS